MSDPWWNSAQLQETIPNRNSKIAPYGAICRQVSFRFWCSIMLHLIYHMMQFRNLIGTANCCYLISSYCTKHVAILEIGAIGRQVWKCHNIKCVEIPQSNNEMLHHNFILPCYASTSRASLGHITIFFGKLLWKDWVISILSIILLVCI